MEEDPNKNNNNSVIVHMQFGQRLKACSLQKKQRKQSG